MQRYLSLYFHFFKNSLMRDLEFRFHVLAWTITNLVWFALMFISVELIFGQVQEIAGWTRYEVLLLTCTQALFVDVLWTLVLLNLGIFSRYIRKGDLDFVLVKPVNPRFFVSTRYFESDHYARMIILPFLMVRFLGRLGVQPPVFAWVQFLVLFALGVFIFYNLFFLLTTTNFWFVKLFNLGELFDEVLSVGRVPVYVFQKTARFLFIYILPVGFIATFPTQALLGRISLGIWLSAVFLAAVLFCLSQFFWNFALKRYTSAGG